MKNNKEFNNILDGCLESVMGGASIEECLELYPDYAKELRPLLLTAAGARQAVDIRPRRAFRDRAGYEFQRAIREMEPAPARSRGFFEVLKPAWATLILVIIVLAAGSGTVFASNSSLPGEPLYSVKMATESVRLTFAFSEEAKADLYVKMADRRVDEIIQMAEKGEAVQVEAATDKLQEHLLAMAGLDIVGGADMLQTQLTKVEAAEAPLAMMEPSATPLPKPIKPGGEFETAVEEAAPPPMLEQKTLGAPDDEGDLRSNPAEAWASDGEQGGLKGTVANSAVMNSQALNSLLDDVDEEMRAALNRAIEVLNAGYFNIISNLK